MKHMKRILAVLLAAALLAGLLPVAALTAFAENAAEPGPLTASKRSTVMLDASGLKKADTVILGYAQNGSKVYPLEWQLADAEADSLGRTGGRLLISKYLLPAATTDTATGGINTAASYGSISMSDGSTTAIHMPEAAAVLPAFKSDADYIANLGANLGKYDPRYPADVNAGLAVRGDKASADRRALENASFFELSAEEAESYISNAKDDLSAKILSKLLRRPYAAGYAVEDAGDRSWALRGTTLLGDPIAIMRGASHFTYENSAEGLVNEAEDSTLLSRLAFNLRTNAVSFWYSVEVDPKINANNTAVAPEETEQIFGGSTVLTPAEQKSGVLTWRAALETLPLTAASVEYRADGSVELVFEDNAVGYKIGVLTADSEGNLLAYGTARDDDRGGHVVFTPDDGVSRMYFFTYRYNSVSRQLYTSNLIEVTAQRSSAMSLGTGLLQAGDKVYFNDSLASVVSADTGSTGMELTGTTGTMTKTGSKNNEYTVFNNDAMFLAMGSGKTAKYQGNATNDLPTQFKTLIDRLNAASYIDRAAIIAEAQANTGFAETDFKQYTALTDGLKNDQNGYLKTLFNEPNGENSPLGKALAYTWLDDSSYGADGMTDFSWVSINFNRLGSQTSTLYFAWESYRTIAAKDVVNGQRLFVPSYGEAALFPDEAFSRLILRTQMTETYTLSGGTLFPQPEISLDSPVTNYCDGKIYTVTSERSENPSEAELVVGFNLRKDSVVYAVQTSALDRSLTSAGNLHPVGSYNSSCSTYEAAILDDTLETKFRMGLDYSGSILYTANGLPENAHVTLLVTDAAGNVKQYGRISGEEFMLDPSDYDYGARVYALCEYESASADHPTVYASAPQLIYEKKTDGELRIVPASYGPCETLFLDTSDVKCAGGSTELKYGWYGEEMTDSKADNGLTCGTEITDVVMNAFVFHSDDYSAQLFAHAEQTAEFPVRPGRTDPDYFTGGTLYYGADSDADTADYAWTVVGNPTEGITALKETTGDQRFEDPTCSNAVELLRKTATPHSSTDTVLRGYMNSGVLLTDIKDETINVRNLSADAYSAKEQTVFRMSYADYTALADCPAARFAAADGSSWGREYLLRNQKAGTYFAVDTLLNLQGLEPGTNAATREGVNLNNKTVLFYSPADCDLTFDALRRCRQSAQGEWKATVYDTEAFEDMQVQNILTGFNYLSVEATFDTAMEDRQITAWGLKDGRIIWMDSSEPCEEAGTAHAYFTWDGDAEFDELYFVARKNNGTYRTDICGDVYSAYPTEVQVQFYIDGEYAEYYDHYELKDSQNNARTVYEGGEQVYFSAITVDELRIQKVEVIFSDGTKITKDKLDTQNYGMDFTVKGANPVVKVYIETRPVPIEVLTIVEPLYEDEVIADPVTVDAPTSCLPGQPYDFTVDLQPGFYISKITCSDMDHEQTLPNDNPVTVIGRDEDGQVKELTGYAPGTYTKLAGYDGDILIIYVKELPFSLQLVSDPVQGGVVSAKLPDDRSFTTLAEGDEVTVYEDTYADYIFRGFTIKTQNGEETELEANGNNAAFTMPDDNVIVTAHFSEPNNVTVRLFMDGKPTDTGASWTLTDDEGTERSVFAHGEQAHISAQADTGLVISHIQVDYSDGTGFSEGSLSGSQDFDFTVRDTDPVVGIYLTKAQVPVSIEAQTVDAKGNVLDEQGGAVYAPGLVKYGDSFAYNASAFEGYYISAITRNGAAVENPAPEEYTSAGKTVIGYGAEEYGTAADCNEVSILVRFTKLADGHRITSEFVDISLGTPAAVTASAVYTVNGEQTDVFYAGDEVTATVSCNENFAVASVDSSPDTEIAQTEKYTFTFTMPDDDLDLTYNLKKLAVRSAFLHVNEDINLIYSVQVPEGFTEPSAEFTFMDKTYTSTDYKLGADGRYNFEFENVTPQYMGEPVDITVTADYGAYTYSHTNTGYSVRQYCANMLGKTDDELLRTLLSDILVYGEKAQYYTDYKTDEPVTEGAALSASTYPGLSGLHEWFEGTADEDVYWTAATLRLSNNVALELKFHASDIEGLSVTVSIDGRTETFTEFTPVEGQADFYTVTFRGIYATEFDFPVSASFYKDGAQLGNTLKYSVNIYICNKQNDGNEVFAELVKALYNYGASSLKYYQERMLKK